MTYDWNEDNYRELSTSLPLPAAASRNRTIYAHVYFTRIGQHPDPRRSSYDPSGVIYRRHELTRYVRPEKKATRMNLLTGRRSNEGEKDRQGEEGTTVGEEGKEDEEDELRSELYWKPSLSLHLIHDFTPLVKGAVPGPLQRDLKFDGSGRYWPIVYCNDFWLTREKLMKIDQASSSSLSLPAASEKREGEGKEKVEGQYSTTEFPLTITFSPMVLWKYTLQVQMEESWKMQEGMGTQTARGTDMIRDILGNTSPWLLAVTALVSTLHMLFDFLAFKNDISFWKNIKTMKGLSAKSVAFNTFFQVRKTLEEEETIK